MLTAYAMPQLIQNARAHLFLLANLDGNMSVTKAEVTKAAVSYTLSLGYEIKKEQLDVIVQYVLTEISKVHANLFHRSFPNLHNNS